MRITPVFAALFVAASLHAQIVSETPVGDIAYIHNEERILGAGSNDKDFLLVGARGSDAVFAHRITAGGELLDTTGIRIALPKGADNTRLLGAFWSGDAYTVLIWTQLTQTNSEPVVLVARVSGDGRLLAPPRQILSGRIFYGAASNGRRIVVSAAQLAVLDAEGNVVEEKVDLPLQAATNFDVHVASNGSAFALSWGSSAAGQNSVDILTLDANGHPTGALQTIAGTGRQLIASDGNDYVVVYGDAASSNFAVHVNASGQLSQPNSLSRLQLPAAILTMVWNGSAYVVGASTQTDIATPVALQLDHNGMVLDTTNIFQGNSQAYFNWMNLASNGRQVIASWKDARQSSPRSYADLLERDLHVSKQIPIGLTAIPQSAASVASSGKDLFVVWEENGAIYGTRMTLSGQRLDAHPIEFATEASAAAIPRVVWDGEAYVVAWRFTSLGAHMTAGFTYVIMERRLPDGSFKGVVGPFDEPCVSDFDMASDGDATFVVASTCQPSRITGVRVHRDGFRETPVAISPAGMLAGGPRVAWSGSQYLVAWSELTPSGVALLPIVFPANILAARVSASMTVLDPSPIWLSAPNDSINDSPRVASDGRDFLVAWTHTAPSSDVEVQARAISAAGVRGDLAGVAAGRAGSLIWDGRQFAVAFSTLAGDTFLRRMAAGTTLPIEIGGDESYGASLAAIGNGTLVASYVRVATEAVYGSVPRVFLRSPGVSAGRPRPVH